MTILRKSSVFILTGILPFVFTFQKPNPPSTFHPPNAFLEFHCPPYALPANTPLLLTGEVIQPRETMPIGTAAPISYHWVVDGGRVITGQGSSRVTIQPENSESTLARSLRVTLEPKNAPPETEINKTCLVRLEKKCNVTKVAEYLGISLKAEKQQLDRIAKEILNLDKHFAIYLVAYGGRESCIGEADWRTNRVKTYFVENHKIDANRILTVNGGFRKEFALAIFISPNTECGPLPTPSLMMSDVQLGGTCEQKYRTLQNQ